MRKEEEEESEKNAVRAVESRVPGRIDLRYSKMRMDHQCIDCSGTPCFFSQKLSLILKFTPFFKAGAMGIMQ